MMGSVRLDCRVLIVVLLAYLEGLCYLETEGLRGVQDIRQMARMSCSALLRTV